MSKNSQHGGLWSNQFTRQFLLGALLTLAIIVLSIFMLQISLSPVDDNGCFKYHFNIDWFNPKYKAIIKQSNNKNPLCRK